MADHHLAAVVALLAAVAVLLYLSHGLQWANQMVIASVMSGGDYPPLAQLWVVLTWPTFVVYRLWDLLRTIVDQELLRRFKKDPPELGRPIMRAER